MSRRIETGPAPLREAVGAQGGTQEDYLGRLVKYIPAEIIGLYVAASGFVPKGETTCLWIVFTVSFLLTPIFLLRATWDPTKGPLLLQVILATIAFPVWVFALGGPFAQLSWYKSFVGSIILVFVTFIFGFFRPRPGS
jgi:hypothetical protein